jgi:hypothetical protein
VEPTPLIAAGRVVRRASLLIALVLSVPGFAHAQALQARVVGDTLRIRSTSWPVVEGDTLAHLQDGRAVRVEFVLAALGGAAGPLIAERHDVFTLSFDLWEERVAVSRGGTPPKAVSHLLAREAEAWCLDNLALPIADLAARGRAAPFWIRLTSVVDDAEAAAREDDGFLRTLIETFSRPRDRTPQRKSQTAGPLRLADLTP